MNTGKMEPITKAIDDARTAMFRIEPGHYYCFRIDAVDVEDRAGPRGLVGKLEFYSMDGSLLEAIPEGSVRTDRYGQVVYLPTRASSGEPKWSENLVRAPEGAHTVRIYVRNWKCSPEIALKGTVEAVREADRALYRKEFPLRGGLPYRLDLTVQDQARNNRAAILTVEYMDAAGRIVPGLYDGLLSSPRFGCFRYLPAQQGGAQSSLALLPPAKAVTLRLLVHPWHGSTTKLSLMAEPLLQPDVPVNFDPDGWSILHKDKWGMPHALERSEPGLVNLEFDYLVSSSSNAAEPEIQVQFLDEAGMPLAVDRSELDDDVLQIFGLGLSRLPIRFGAFVYRPGGAAAIRFRLAFPSEHIVFMRHVSTPRCVPADSVPRYRYSQLTPGKSKEWEHRVWSTWVAAIRVAAFLDISTGIQPLSFTLTFRDSAGKQLNPDGSLLGVREGNVRQRGNALTVTAQTLPSGTDGIGRVNTELRVLPPRGAAMLVLGLENNYSHVVMVAHEVSACDSIREDRVSPETVSDLLAVEEYSPASASLLAEQFLKDYSTDHRVQMHLLDVFRRLGDLRSLEAVARAATNASGTATAKLRSKALHELSNLQELDTHWLPETGLVDAERRTERGKVNGLRVAHLFKTTVPIENTGGAIRCLNIVNYQRKVGMRPLVVTPLGYPEVGGSGQPWEREVIDGVPYFRLNCVHPKMLRAVPSTTQLSFTAMLTTKLLAQEDVDIIQASSGYRGYEQALVGLAIARKLKVPFVYEVRSYHEHTWRSMADWVLDTTHSQRRIAQENRCMREADAVVTICETMKEGLVKRGIPAQKVFVVPNSVNLEQFSVIQPSIELRKSLGLEDDHVVGYISNVSKREGHHVLLQAVARLRATGMAVKCLVVGKGGELASLRRLAKTLGIAGHVVFTGEVAHDAIPDYYALIDVFVVPRVEDFASDFVTPMKPFEAMAMQLPLVVSDRPALMEVVGQGQRGMTFRTGDHRDLANCLSELLGSPEKRKALAHEGWRWIKEERSWDDTIRIYGDVYAYAMRTSVNQSGDRRQ